MFDGKEYNECTSHSDPDGQLWCSTRTTEENVHVGGGRVRFATNAVVKPRRSADDNCLLLLYMTVLLQTAVAVRYQRRDYVKGTYRVLSSTSHLTLN